MLQLNHRELEAAARLWNDPDFKVLVGLMTRQSEALALESMKGDNTAKMYRDQGGSIALRENVEAFEGARGVMDTLKKNKEKEIANVIP